MIQELTWDSFGDQISSWQDASLDFAILISEAIPAPHQRDLTSWLDQVIRVLKAGGSLFLQGTPERLPYLGFFSISI